MALATALSKVAFVAAALPWLAAAMMVDVAASSDVDVAATVWLQRGSSPSLGEMGDFCIKENGVKFSSLQRKAVNGCWFVQEEGLQRLGDEGGKE